MPTPTSNLEPPAYGGAGGPPIDVTTLARLASEFFATLPSGQSLSLPANPSPPGLPSGPLPQSTTTQIGGFGAAAPGLNLVPAGPDQAAARVRPSSAQAPHAVAQNGLPDTLVTSASGVDGRLGGPTLGVSERSPPSVPSIGSAGAPNAPTPFSSPYYFASASSQQALPGSSLTDFEPARAQSFLLPAAITSRSSSADAPSASAAAAPVASSAPPDDRAGAFYFLDPNRHPGHPAGRAPDADKRAAARVPFNVNAIRRDFPILAARQRPATGLVRQRGHDAKATERDRPPGVLLRARKQQCAPRRA
jgi:cysteine desulfurase/selenocysteine lyase